MKHVALILVALMLSGCCGMKVARRKSGPVSGCVAAGTYLGANGAGYPTPLARATMDGCGNCPPAVPRSFDCGDTYTCPDYTTNRLTR